MNKPAALKILHSLESTTWVAMRVTGILLFFLIGVYVVLVDIQTGIWNVDLDWLETRWNQPLWQLFDFFTALLVTSHTLNGVRYRVYEVVHVSPLRRVFNWILLFLGVLLVGFWGWLIFLVK
jgi:succinate dehydrogenase / fumarate reductase membrane anchor subunit